MITLLLTCVNPTNYPSPGLPLLWPWEGLPGVTTISIIRLNPGPGSRSHDLNWEDRAGAGGREDKPNPSDYFPPPFYKDCPLVYLIRFCDPGVDFTHMFHVVWVSPPSPFSIFSPSLVVSYQSWELETVVRTQKYEMTIYRRSKGVGQHGWGGTGVEGFIS